MDTGNYQYSQYETTAEFDSRINTYSAGQHQQSQNMMSQQSGMFSQQSGMLPQQPGMMSQQSGMSQQWGTMSHQADTMPQQSGMMSQQSGTMSQQSGTMSQQSGVISQQSVMWGGSNSYDMQQSANMWMPQQSSNSFRPPLSADGYASGVGGTNSQQFANMPGQQMPNYNHAGPRQQQGSNSTSYGDRSNVQGTGFQQGKNPSFQQDNNFGQNVTRKGNGFACQQDSYGNNISFQQAGQNMMNQQRNAGSHYQHSNSNVRSSGNQQNSGSGQGNGAYYQPGTSKANDPLDEFYTEIGNVAEEADPTFHHPPFQGSNSSGFDQQSHCVSSTQDSPDMQGRMGQRPAESNAHTGTWRSAMDDRSFAKDGKPFPSQEPDSSTSAGSYNKCSDFADEDTEYCKLCNVYFTSAPMYAMHARGLSHVQRLMAVEAGKDRKAAETPYIVSGKNYTQTVPQESVNGKTGKQSVEDSADTGLNAGCYCEVCDIHVNNERMLWRHYQGKKHLKALKAVQRGELHPKPASQRPVDPNVEKASKLMETCLSSEEISSLNFAFDTLPANEPIVGLGFLVETMENMNQVIECELCKTKGNLYNMVQHVLGLKHRLQYLKVRDRERYDSINKQNKKVVQAEEARHMCAEIEKTEGRGTARYEGPARRIPREHERRLLGKAATPPPAHLLRYKEQQSVMSESEKRLAIETLKRTLLDDFHKRNIDPDTATKILNSRMELLAEYEKRGVPFAVARERVIEEEERFNLLLEFERQVLSFDEAEQRIDHRFELMKMYEKNGFPREEARRKVLDDEVIYDFKRDFVRLGLQREQAQKLAEKRLWMLEHLHYQGLSPEDASKKVISVEKDLKRFLRAMFEEDRQGSSRGPPSAQWMIAGEELENYIVRSCRELGLSADQADDQVSLALEAFERYRTRRIPADEAKCRVLVDDLPIPRQQVEKYPDSMETESVHDPGSKADITNRVLQFKSKLNTVMQPTDSTSDDKETDKNDANMDQEKQLADYDQQSRVEIQNLLSDMLKMKVPADEARKRLVALYKQHENLRENLFPAKKLSKNSSQINDKSSTLKESKQSEAEDKSTEGNQSPQEKSDTKPSSNEKQPSKKDSSATEEMMTESNGKELAGCTEKASGETAQSTSTEKKKHECADGHDSAESSDVKKLTTANDRWNVSVEMFLQQYGLSKEEYLSKMSKRRGSGHERYSPSDLSPRRSGSRSPERGERRWRSQSRSRSRSRSRSTSSRWSQMFKARLRSRSPTERRRQSFEHRGRLRSSDRERDSRFSRRSPGRRSPRRRSPGRRSPFPRSQRHRFSPDRRSPPRRRSPYGHRSPGYRQSPGRFSPWGQSADFSRYPSHDRRPRRSRSRERYHSPYDFESPEMHRIREPLDIRERPRWNRYKSPARGPEFNFADGVWPDVDDPWD